MSTPSRWTKRPEGSNWGEFGSDDQIGRINLLLSSERVLRAAAEIKAGVTFALSLPLELPGGAKMNTRRQPPVLFAAERVGGHPNYLYPFSRDNRPATDILCDDGVVLYTQYSTQWDAFGHVGAEFDADGDGTPEMVFYNGFKGGTGIRPPVAGDCTCGAGTFARPQADALGIETLARTGLQGRGVLLDLAHHFGLDAGPIGFEQISRVLDADGIAVETGDILCLHTGFGRLLIEMAGVPDLERLQRCAALDGRDEKLLDWIDRSGIAAIAADNYAVEIYPARPAPGRAAAMPLHELCLFKLGIPLGELWFLSDLAAWLRANGRTRFFLTAPPLHLTGAVGSPLTPVGTV
jgi:Putative cyclase